MAEAEKQQPDPLCTFELRLLRCTLPPDSPIQTPPSSSLPNPNTNLLHFHSLIHELLQSIESGHYVGALSSDAARAVFVFGPLFYDDSADCAARFYSELVPNRIKSFILGANSDDECELRYRLFLVMAIGVAALLAFTQCNITGPVERLPIMPLIGLLNKEEGGGDGGWVEWEGWARKEITSSVGSDLLGKFSNLQYIVVAKILLISSKDLLLEAHISSLDGIATISWWLVRLLLLQQRLLHDRSSCLFDLLQVVMRESLHHFGSFEKVTSYWGVSLLTEEALAIVSMLHVEAGIMEYIYARIDSSRIHFESAEVTSGLCLSVSGALGFRTVHQVEPKAQLVLLASTNSDDKGNSISAELTRKLSTVSEDNLQQHSHNYNEVSDVLMAPRLLDDYSDSANGAKVIQSGSSGVKQLKAVQQAVILAHCLLIEKSARQDELQRWKMAPYIEAIDSQNSSHHIIQIFCDILRIRWESTRSRTKERALLMMNKVVEAINESCPRVAERIFYCYGANLPTISALRKEYGDLLVSCRMLGEAAKVYEDLELWDNLIYCYQLMEKKAAAVELIKMRLSESPDDPRLWCSLGDVTNNDTCYEKALEVSENKSTRAKRSLARSAYSRGDYEKSKILWESAMALNSLYPDGWFAFGAAALKARDLEKALDAFTHAVQLDPENGEAWNNLACLHMIKKRNKEAFIAFKEALKFKRYSWQMWENFGHVAADIGNFDQAIEALQRVLDISNNKRIDVGLLERVMREIEGKTLSSHSQSLTGDDHDSADISHADADIICGDGSRNSEQGLAKSRDTEHLMELLGKILQRIVKSDTRPEMWGLYATWHKLKGDLTMCSEALLKQVRSYQGSDLWKDRDRFKKFAHASVELCKVYMELANHNTSRRELLAAEMLLKNTIKQAGNFSETEEFANLQNSLDMVKMKLQASSVCAA